MNIRRPLVLVVLASLLVTPILLADARVSQKTQVQFGGMLGGAMNVFGGKAAKEGITSDVAVKGNRRISRMAETAEIVDLDEEKIYNVDFSRKSYRVTTFAELRKQFEEAMKDAGGSEGGSSKRDPNAKEYEVDFDVKATGQKQAINGFDANQTIATVTIREKGKTLAQAGGAVLTADMWLTPRVPAMKEVEDFERRYLKKLWGEAGFDLRSMAAVMALAPQLSKAMKTFQEKQADLDGTAVRSVLTFETVADPRQSASSDDAPPSSIAMSALGGLMKKARKKDAEQEGGAKGGPERKMLFRSNNEVLSAAGSATPADVAIPAGFTQKK